MKRYCFALDLNDDPALIEEYKRYHRPEGIWPEVMESSARTVCCARRFISLVTGW